MPNRQLRIQLADRLFAGALCLLMVAQPQIGFAAAASKKSKPKPTAVKQLEGDERVLHALNRFTFGPRPSDLEAVKNLGLDSWFEDQLHPEKLDQSALNSQLAQYPSIQKLSVVALMERFPNDRMIHDAADNKLKLPQDSIERAIYNVQLERYFERRKGEAKDREKAVLQNKRDLDELAAGNTRPSMANAKPVVLDTTHATAEPALGAMSVSPSVPTSTPSSLTASGSTSANTINTPAPTKTDSSEMTSMLPEQKMEQETKTKNERILAQYLALYPRERIRRMLGMSPANLDSFQRSLSDTQRQVLYEGMNPEQHEIALALENPRNIVVDEMMDQRVVRDLYSNAQLEEVMTDFWLNHFNVFLRKNEEMPYYLASFERDVIRPHVFGKFEELLEATAHSPAMMLYLDNASSIGPNSIAAVKNQGRNRKAPDGLNENYARELMELHTVGVNGGYTQADVTNVARILTGWGVDKPTEGGDFLFNERRHEPGSKLVMGRTFNEDGENEGRALIHMLATKPETANFICRKLAIRFVSDDPPQPLIDRMAKSFIASGGDTSAVLRTLFHSPEFWNPENYRSKVKTPLEFVISSVRASGVMPKDPRPVVNAIRDMGMPLYGSIPPTGYTSKSNAWLTSSALVNRMNFAMSLTTNRVAGCAKNWADGVDPWLNQSQMSVVPAKEEERLATELVGGGVSATTSAAILRYIIPMPAVGGNKSAPAQTPLPPVQAQPLTQAEAEFYNTPQKIVAEQWEQKDEFMAGLLMGSPEFQRR